MEVFDGLRIPSKHGGRFIGVDVRCEEDRGMILPVIIFIHGFKGFKDWGPFNLMADYWATQGFCVVKVNLSHNGTTPEHSADLVDLEAFSNNTLSIELDDVREVMHWVISGRMADETFKEDLPYKVFLAGHSRGGALAILSSCENTQIKAVSAFGAVSDFEALWHPEHLKEWEEKGVIHIWHQRLEKHLPLKYNTVLDFFENRGRVDLKSNPIAMQAPLKLFHTKDDETVPVRMAEHIKEMVPHAELVLFEKGGHTFGAEHPWPRSDIPEPLMEVTKQTANFFKQF